ncbi:MAG: FAD-binding oxidoreductase, partial [Litorilinea sp.]
MQKTADLVIIGAGIVGSSCVYHLARKGWDNIVVLDQGPLFETGGSTSHAPGLVFQTSASRTMCQLSQYTVALYNSLAWEGQPGFYPVGGIEVAYSAERWRDLHRKLGMARAWGIEDATLLSPQEVQARVPLLNPDVIHGGYFVPSDGIAKAVRLCTAMCKAAEQAQSAVFYGNTTVTGFDIQQGQVRGVHTDQGTIATPRVLLCGGI